MIILILGFVAIGAYKIMASLFEKDQQVDTSDSRKLKATIVIGSDNWIGYFPLCSSQMRKRMRRVGYLIRCEDDKANYPERMNKLARGEYQFIVATVDSYILNAKKNNYPGVIVAVLDESKGGDAIVAWKNKIKNLDGLKNKTNVRVAFTPGSPSAHLLKSLAVHFDIGFLRNKNGSWRKEVDGSEKALKALLSKKTDAAVLWEPDVSRALRNKKIVKLIGTEDTDKLIVDILLVNRKYSTTSPNVTRLLLKNYFLTLKFYRNNPDRFTKDAAKAVKLSTKRVKTLFKGVKWANLNENAQGWFGVSRFSQNNTEGLIDTINSTVKILLDNNDFNDNPLPDKDPYRLTNSNYIDKLYQQTHTSTQFGKKIVHKQLTTADPLTRKFSALGTAEWNQLRVIGTLKVHPIVFQSGTADLTFDGKQEIDKAVQNLKHYPNFRLFIKGHTGTRGDPQQNNTLSRQRAESVTRYMQITHGIDANRLRPVGFGSQRPLARLPNESLRSYNYRLPRVELFLVAEDI